VITETQVSIALAELSLGYNIHDAMDKAGFSVDQGREFRKGHSKEIKESRLAGREHRRQNPKLRRRRVVG